MFRSQFCGSALLCNPWEAVSLLSSQSLMEFITWDTGGFPLPYNCSLPVSLTSVVASLLQKNISKLKLSFPGSPALVCQMPPREILYSAGGWTPAEPACSGPEVDVCSADAQWLPSNCLGVSVRRRQRQNGYRECGPGSLQ